MSDESSDSSIKSKTTAKRAKSKRRKNLWNEPQKERAWELFASKSIDPEKIPRRPELLKIVEKEKVFKRFLDKRYPLLRSNLNKLAALFLIRKDTKGKRREEKEKEKSKSDSDSESESEKDSNGESESDSEDLSCSESSRSSESSVNSNNSSDTFDFSSDYEEEDMGKDTKEKASSGKKSRTRKESSSKNASGKKKAKEKNVENLSSEMDKMNIATPAKKTGFFVGDLEYSVVVYENDVANDTTRKVKIEVLCGSVNVEQAIMDESGMVLKLKILRTNTLLNPVRKTVASAIVHMPAAATRAVENMREEVFENNFEYKKEGRIVTWKEIALPFKCKRTLCSQTLKAYEHDGQNMRSIGQFAWIFEAILDEVKDIWIGPQEVGLDPATAAFLNNAQNNNTRRTRPRT